MRRKLTIQNDVGFFFWLSLLLLNTLLFSNIAISQVVIPYTSPILNERNVSKNITHNGTNSDNYKSLNEDHELNVVSAYLNDDRITRSNNVNVFDLIETFPTRHEVNVPRNASIRLTFDQKINQATVDGGSPEEFFDDNILVRSELTGFIAGTFTGDSTTNITFSPTRYFLPGEVVTIQVTKGVESIEGTRVATATVFQFTVVSARSPEILPLFVEQPAICATADLAICVCPADLDGDGDLDVISASFNDGKIAWYANDGRGLFTEQPIISDTADGVVSIHTADLDSDGDLDILSTSFNDNRIAWYQNDGSGVFIEQSAISITCEGPSSVHAGDFDGDGDLDVISASTNDNKVLWHQNDGSGVFIEQPAINTTSLGERAVYPADLDGDGDLDVISASFYDDKIIWYANDGSGVFTEQPAISSIADGVESIYAADLDGDGDLDVLSASFNDNRIAWYINDGNGVFVAQQTISNEADGAYSVHAADLDGDGDLDVISASVIEDKIKWYINEGHGEFRSEEIIATTDGAISVHAADLDGDGDLDVLSASANDDKIAWYANVHDTPPSAYSIRIDQKLINSMNASDVSFSFIGAEIGTIYDYIFSCNGDSINVTGSGTVVTETNQITGIDLSELPDGIVTLEVTLTSSYGNTGEVTIDTKIKDTTPPTDYYVLINQSPINNSNVSNVNFSFIGAEVGTTYNYTISSDGGDLDVTGTGITHTAADLITNIDLSGLADGIITLAVTLTDSLGNTGAIATDTETKDALSPTGYSVAINQSPINMSNASNVSFSLIGAEIGTTYQYTFSSDSGDIDVIGTGLILTATNLITGIDLSGLADGAITVSVSLTDAKGNRGAVVTDTETKYTTLLSGYSVGMNQTSINTSNVSNIGFSFTEAIIGTTYNYTFSSDGDGTEVIGTGTIQTGTDQLTDIDLSELTDGKITLLVTLTDTIGNIGVIATHTTTKDTTPPSGYSVTIDQNPISIENVATVSFSFAGAEVGSTYNYTFSNDDGRTSVTRNGIINTVTDQVTSIDLSDLDNGTVTLLATLTDNDGNKGEQAIDTSMKDTGTRSLASLKINNFISPNRDNKNDYWKAGENGELEGCNVRIFTSWGNTIYESNAYLNNWDGTDNGRELPEGTYYYTISCSEQTSRSGYITLMK